MTAGVHLLAQVAQTGGLNYLEVFVVYLAATQERAVVREFVEMVQQHTVDIGGEMLTYAEELMQEGIMKGMMKGKIEGKIEGQVETIESLLSVGAEWAMITAATGITPSQFARLKKQLAQTTTPPSEADQESA